MSSSHFANKPIHDGDWASGREGMPMEYLPEANAMVAALKRGRDDARTAKTQAEAIESLLGAET